MLILLVRHNISIHAPPRGATQQRQLAACGNPYFNSRPSARGDWSQADVAKQLGIFQFTPLREGRPQRTAASGQSALRFQFTPLREGRPAPCKGRLRGSYFNSRPSARGDGRRRCTPQSPRYFNSRPSARGDVVKVPICRAAEISIHAPPRGATFPVSESPGVGKISIHAPPRGATHYALEGTPFDAFQFTPLREGRQRWRRWWTRRANFNSRPSARGDD